MTSFFRAALVVPVIALTAASYAPDARAACYECVDANVSNTVYFQARHSNLSPATQALLDRWVVTLNAQPASRIVIEGHTDERGSAMYNLLLGYRRASAVKLYLVARGIDPVRISTTSFGKTKPAVIGSGESAWKLNRRVEGFVNTMF